MHQWTRENSSFEEVLAEYQFREVLRAYETYGNLSYGNILDVGCNNAFITQRFIGKFKVVEGVDKSKHFIEVARKRCPKTMFYTSKIETFQPRKKYDFIIALGLLEHLSEPIEVLRKLKTMICSDGIIHVQVPNAYSLNRQLGLKMGIIKEIYELHHDAINIDHTKEYDLKILESEVKQADLQIMDSGGFFLKPFTNQQMQFFLEEWNKPNNGWKTNLADGLYQLGRDMQNMAALLYVTAR